MMGVSGECRAQRLVLAGGERLWTVLGGDHRPVGPAEEFLEYLRVQRVSSNTVKSYAHALALWWQYLQVFGLSWDAVTLEAVGGFLAWLRTGDGPRVVSIEQRPARFAESTIAARLQAVVSCYRYHQFNGVELGRDLVRLVHSRGGSYKPMLEHAARRARRRQAVIRVRRPGRAAPPLLTPGQIERICDACAAWDGEAREWRGCVRDRLLWALSAESGGLVKRGPRAPTPMGADPACDDLVVIDLVTRARKSDKQAWDALVERYSPLIWSICRRHQLGDADAEDVGQNVWLQLVQQLDRIHDPAALPGWLATVTRRECSRVLRMARRPLAAGYVLDADALPDEQAGTTEQELLAAEQQAALRQAFRDLPPCGQRLIALLLEDPPVPYAEISARLGIPVGSIGPNRGRCLDKLRRHPAIAALIDAGNSAT